MHKKFFYKYRNSDCACRNTCAHICSILGLYLNSDRQTLIWNATCTSRKIIRITDYIGILYQNMIGTKNAAVPFYMCMSTESYSVVVVLLFYVHGKHLRSCRDGQLT